MVVLKSEWKPRSPCVQFLPTVSKCRPKALLIQLPASIWASGFCAGNSRFASAVLGLKHFGLA